MTELAKAFDDARSLRGEHRFNCFESDAFARYHTEERQHADAIADEGECLELQPSAVEEIVDAGDHREGDRNHLSKKRSHLLVGGAHQSEQVRAVIPELPLPSGRQCLQSAFRANGGNRRFHAAAVQLL